MSKIYLEVPFSEKEKAKEQGAKWDKLRRQWYTLESKEDNELINLYGFHYLDIPYYRKDEFKQFGCKWDDKSKQWYTYKSHPELNAIIERSKWFYPMIPPTDNK